MLTYRNANTKAVRLPSVMAVLKAARSGGLTGLSMVWADGEFTAVRGAEHPLTRELFAVARTDAEITSPAEPNLSPESTARISGEVVLRLILFVYSASVTFVCVLLYGRLEEAPNPAAIVQVSAPTPQAGYVAEAGATLWTLDDKGATTSNRNLLPFDEVSISEVRPDGVLWITTKKGLIGEVRAADIVLGSGWEARDRFCAREAGARPETGEILDPTPGGSNTIVIQNGNSRDAFVKLKDSAGLAAFSFFVRANDSASLVGVPSGTFRMDFELGERFSRGCHKFLSNKTASSFQDLAIFEALPGNYSRLTATLASVPDGNAVIKPISPDEF